MASFMQSFMIQVRDNMYIASGVMIYSLWQQRVVEQISYAPS